MSTLPLTPDELLTTTRSVRKRLDLTRPVPPEVIRECLEIAMQGPSGSNTQGWHWVVISDPDQRAAVAQFYTRSFDQYAAQAEERAAAYDDPDRQATQRRVSASAAHLSAHMAEVPVLVLACIEARSLGSGNQAGLWGSLLPAAWSFMLAARARGLGTTWTTLHLAYEREVAEVLGLPENIHQGVLIPTAYYTGDTFKAAPRVSLDDIVHLDRW